MRTRRLRTVRRLWIHHLALAADQFVADRPLDDDPNGKTLIAGYHWFGDWGRDTMIALPGITLTTGRPEIAARILRTFAKFVDGGMLPNMFPDAGQTPEYNTVDATLWYFEAVRQYVAATNDIHLLKELYPVLAEIDRCPSARYPISDSRRSERRLALCRRDGSSTHLDGRESGWL